MKFQRVVQAVYFEPWNITRSGWQAVHAIVQPYLDGTKTPPAVPGSTFKGQGRHLTTALSPSLADSRRGEGDVAAPARVENAGPESGAPKQEDGDYDFFGNPLPKLEITHEGVAIIPVQGTLIHHGSLMDKMCGACSYDDIKRDLMTALGTKNIQKIILNIDSPGGMAVGAEECARKIIEVGGLVPIEAVTDSLCGSAAYYLAAACHKIRCTPTAEVGSIGTLLPILDSTMAFEMQGLEVQLFKSGPLKGAGMPGTKLSTAQKEYFQGIVDKFAGMFKGHVQRQRELVPDEAMQGQIFIGDDAKEMALVDEIVDDIEECYFGAAS